MRNNPFSNLFNKPFDPMKEEISDRLKECGVPLLQMTVPLPYWAAFEKQGLVLIVWNTGNGSDEDNRGEIVFMNPDKPAREVMRTIMEKVAANQSDNAG